MTIRPTPLAWKAAAFSALLVTGFFAAPYQNLFFLLLVFLGALGVLGVWWTLLNARGIRGTVDPMPPFEAGSSASFTARLTAARGRHTQLRVVLEFSARGGTVLATAAVPVIDAASGSQGGRETTAAGDLAALPRGVHIVTRAWVETTYPFGILRVRRALAAPAEIVVHPAPAPLHAAPGGGLAALAGAPGGAGADQPAGVRDWRDGDEVRRIHWRATARRGRPVVTDHDALAGDGLEIVLDRRCAPDELEAALSIAAALVLAARDLKERLTVHTQGDSRTFGPGHAPFGECLRLLAGAECVAADGPPPPPAATSVLRLPRARAAVPA